MQRLITYTYEGLRQWGVLAPDGQSIYPAYDLEETYYIPLAETLEEFIETGEEGLLNLAKMLESNSRDHSVEPVALSDVRLAFCPAAQYLLRWEKLSGTCAGI